MQSQYIKAIESSNIISKTDISGIITFVNDEFCHLLGYTKDELIGKNHNIIRHPDVPKESFTTLWREILAKKIYKTTVKNLTKDKKTIYLNTTIIPILGEDDEIVEFVAFRYDVTTEHELALELIKKEGELAKLNKELELRVKQKTKELQELNKSLELRIAKEIEQNQEKQNIMFWQARHASLGQMLANIAHQWRQPLMELALILFNMKKASLQNDGKEVEKRYEEAKINIKSMSSTIDDFSNFFNPSKTKESFSVKKALEDALHLIDLGDINLKIALEDMRVVGSSNELTQVIINLVKNSIDAFSSNAVLIKELDIKSYKTKEYAMIEVSDNAGGIPKEMREKIFEPYFSTKHKNRGSGLGLFMSKMIIQKSLDGTLELSSSGTNSTFSIKIPLGL